MKIKLLPLFLCIIGINTNAQYLGINTSTPNAALDVKSKTDDGSNVIRFSTPPSNVDKTKEFVLFAGEKVNNGYNLRKISINELFNMVGIYIPSTKRIVVTNTTKQDIQYGITYTIILNNEVYNSGNNDYKLHANGEIEILKEGYYDINSWIGFERITAQQENDILVILNKKSTADPDFSEAKASIISRSYTPYSFQIGNGVGTSFSFVQKFKAKDRVKLSVRSYIQNLNTLPNSVSLTITRVDNEYVNITQQ